MAEEKIVFEVDVTSLAKALGDSQTQLEIYKRDMELAIEANGKFSEQANKAAGLVAAQTKAVQQQTGAITRLTQAELALGGSINEIVKDYNASNKSIDQNRKVLNALTAEYIKTANPSKQLTDRIKGISDELKKQEGVIGDTRRNVGNYFNEFAKGVPQLGSAVEGIKGLGTAFKGAGGGVAGLSAGLATLGLPLIIAGVTALIDVFKEFKPVADAIESSITGIKAAFGALLSGNSIKEAVSQSLELLNVMRDLEDTQNAFNISQEKYNNQIQRLIIASKDRTKSDKERLALIKDANDLEKKSFDETVARTEKEIQVRERNFKSQVGINSAQLKLLVEGTSQAALNLRSQLEKNTAFKEKDLEILQGLFLQREKFSGDSLALQEKLANNTNKIQEELKAEQDKRDEAEVKRIEAQNKRAELAASLYRKTQEEKFAALKKFDEDAKKNAEKAEADRIAELTTLYNTEKQFADKQLQLDLGYVDLSVATEEDKFKRKQEIQINYLEKQLDNAIQFLGADGSITKAELQGIEAIKLALAKAKAEMFPSKKDEKETFGSALGLDKETLKEVSGGLQVAGDVIDGISSIASAATQVRLNEIDAETNAEIEKVNQSTLSEEEKIKKISAINAKANKEKYEAEKAAFEVNKALQIVNAIIGTAVGVVNAFQLGPIAGAIAAAVIAATGVAQIAVIASQAPPPPPSKFATGVIGLDGAGTETSDSIDARLSKGESVLTAKATRKYHRQLAYMEMSVGNKPNYQFGGGMFAGGFIPSVSGDGGFLARETVKQSDSALMMSEAIRNGFALAPAPILSIVELNTKQKDINRSVNLSEA